MLEEIKRYAGLADDCPPGQDEATHEGDSLLGDGDGSSAYGYDPEDPEDSPDDPPPRYCYREPSRLVKRTLKITVGGVLLLVGLVMVVAPGPALIVIPVSLGILASEIPWLRRHLHALRMRIHDYRIRRKRARRAARQARKMLKNQ